MANRTENAVVEATLFWANLTEKNDMSGKYQVDLGQLSADTVKLIESWGVSVKNDEGQEADEDGKGGKPNKGNFITAKSNYPIKVVFKAGVDVVDPSTIGNETVANVKINPWDWKFKSKTGTSIGVSKLQVTALTTFARDAGGDDGDDEDFPDSVPAPSSSDEAPFDLDDFEDA